MDDRWIVVRNWDKFQHYTDRTPVWIKLYTNLNSEDEWLNLSLSDRGLLVSIWCEYARSKGQLRVLSLAKSVGLRPHYAHLYRHLERLNHAGFIHLVASKPLAQRREENKKKELRAITPKPKPAETANVQRANVSPKDAVKAIRTMIQNGVITDLVDLEAEIFGAHLNSNVGDDLRKLLQ
jgi:hypothetical protein